VIKRQVRLEGRLTDAQQARLLEIADRCPVHKTLNGDLRIETSLLL
jgi:putative redox protein